MHRPPAECLRCRGPMEAGFVLDRGHYGLPGEQRWVEGEARRSFWTGLNTEGRTAYSVVTYRCERCGLLEAYAHEPAKV